MTLGSDRKWLVAGTGALALLVMWAGLARLEERRSATSGDDPSSGIRLTLDEIEDIPEEAWTDRFRSRIAAGDWAGLDEDLDSIGDRDPDLYRRYQLGYLQARAKIGYGELDDGREALQPFLAPGHLLRDLALHYDAEAAEAQERLEEAARQRETLVVEYPKATHRQTSLEKLLAYLSEKGDPQALADLATRLGGTVDAAGQRDLESRVIAARGAKGEAGALADGLRFLRGGTLGDDAAERVALALDRPEWRERLSGEDLVAVGEALRNARHFDRAVELLRRGLPLVPAKRDDMLFSIGRADFGRERYAEAEKTYLEGTGTAKDGETRASFFYQASRCAQLLGDDKRAEDHLAKAIAAGGETTRASAAHTQRLRIRIKQRRFAEARADLRAVQSRFRTSHAVVEAVLAYAIGMIGAGQPQPALRELERLRPKLIEKKEVPEIQYWKARALEGRNPRRAVRTYLEVLRADTPTHFAFLAKRRLTAEPLASRARAEARAQAVRVQRLLDAGKLDEARRGQTDVVLLAPMEDEAAELAKLADVYRRIDAYRAVLELPAPEYPRFPLFPAEGEEHGRLELLLAAGLFDDAADLVVEKYPLRPLPQGVARSEALRRGQASRASIYAAEVVAREEVPPEYLPPLLPRLLRELLYPRYFFDVITAESPKHGADPRLVLAIMREESRFNPRAKSAAAARGLLQFIITTAREVGQAIGLVDVEGEDLYDPRVIIQLGAKYIGDLLNQFERNAYQAAAAYNAGPNQARLWARMAPAPGNDMYMTAINFDETKDYVRKVLNSYERYAEIYENQPPAGGVRPEP